MAALASPLFTVEDAGQDLARRTVCIKVQSTRLGNSKKVNTSLVHVDTDKSMLRISKRLFDCREFKAVANFDAEITRYLESVCLPFERSVYICPLAMLTAVDNRLKQFAEERPKLVEAFVDVYPALCDQAPDRFRALHNPLDFLPLDQVRAAFSFSWRYISFGVPDKLREIAPSLWEEERDKVARLMTEAAAEAQQVMRAVMAELVQHLADRLQDVRMANQQDFTRPPFRSCWSFWRPSISAMSPMMRNSKTWWSKRARSCKASP